MAKESNNEKKPKKELDSRILKIAAKIKKMRKDAGYTSSETFSYEHDLSRVYYWKIEKGANITLESLLKILDIHKVTFEDFVRDI